MINIPHVEEDIKDLLLSLDSREKELEQFLPPYIKLFYWLLKKTFINRFDQEIILSLKTIFNGYDPSLEQRLDSRQKLYTENTLIREIVLKLTRNKRGFEENDNGLDIELMEEFNQIMIEGIRLSLAHIENVAIRNALYIVLNDNGSSRLLHLAYNLAVNAKLSQLDESSKDYDELISNIAFQNLHKP